MSALWALGSSPISPQVQVVERMLRLKVRWTVGEESATTAGFNMLQPVRLSSVTQLALAASPINGLSLGCDKSGCDKMELDELQWPRRDVASMMAKKG